MHKNVIQNQDTARRCHSLGNIGEELAKQVFEKNGFVNVRNLNESRKNYAFADFYAERGGNKYVISVKARNKYEFGTGRLNGRYKLGAKCHEHAREAEKINDASAAWLVISLEEKTFSAYFGLLDSLRGSTGVAMTEDAIKQYERLALNQEHGFDNREFKNSYRSATTYWKHFW